MQDNVIDGLATAAVTLTHRFTLRRERAAAEDKLARERYFISTELVFRLERFAQECADVVNDEGEEDDTGSLRTTARVEAFSVNDIAGDWRVLPDRIQYRIRELTVLIPEAKQRISVVRDWDYPPEWPLTFRERRYQYSRLGMRAILLAKRLRKLNHMPSSRLDANSDWSAQHVLWKQWRKERKSRARMAREDAV